MRTGSGKLMNRVSSSKPKNLCNHNLENYWIITEAFGHNSSYTGQPDADGRTSFAQGWLYNTNMLKVDILCLSTIKIFSVKRFMFPPHRSIGTRPCVSISATTHQVEIPARWPDVNDRDFGSWPRAFKQVQDEECCPLLHLGPPMQPMIPRLLIRFRKDIIPFLPPSPC